MSAPALVSLGDSQTVATLFAELHALREDVKILLGNQKQSLKFQRAAALSNDGDAGIDDFNTMNRGVGSMPSAAEEALRDLNVEVKSLKTAMQADLRAIKDSFLAGFEALGPRRSQEPGPIPECPNIKDVAIAIHQQHQGKV